tara:strand:+ start:893 stop:1801 length:909 start_codon:yes stop_codon:yes gene_type:complete
MNDDDSPYKLDKLLKNFDNILILNEKIDREKELMKTKLSKLKEMHTLMSKTNSKQIFLFCLDSFFFQYKTFSMELENLNKFASMMKNRMYCDYYKLYKLINKYINENKDELNIEMRTPMMPAYKDLEPFYDYGIDNIKLVYRQMIDCVKEMCVVSMDKEAAIKEYTVNTHAGYSISNFVNTLSHDNHILKAQTELYINYISFFQLSQQKQIKRLFQSYSEFDVDIENNLNSDHAFTFDDINKDHNFTMVDSMHQDATESQIDTIPVLKEMPTPHLHIDDASGNHLIRSNDGTLPVFTTINDK